MYKWKQVLYTTQKDPDVLSTINNTSLLKQEWKPKEIVIIPQHVFENSQGVLKCHTYKLLYFDKHYLQNFDELYLLVTDIFQFTEFIFFLRARYRWNYSLLSIIFVLSFLSFNLVFVMIIKKIKPYKILSNRRQDGYINEWKVF